MPLEHVTTHLETARARLLESYRDKPNFDAIQASYMAEVQALEDAIHETISKSYLPSAEGKQLEIIGRIVGEARNGRIDSLYKLWIAARIIINASQGHVNDIIKALRAVTSASFTIKEYAPAYIEIRFADSIPGLAAAYAEIAFAAKSGGIRLSVFWPIAAGSNGPFTFKNIGDADNPELGFLSVAF